ncbi:MULTISPECIES: hypothetical protein [Larkinella]|uniref:Uncharacterized protein n=1 Tax=Larkinella humicola TaxID=2607654 RepID=A0A5N1JN51_9BACT|nr:MULTISPECIES: hypothetical protein [Larkinella]KAA9356867.1 hypothetical protein F0P93_03760 [Larkinella humicola]
MNKIYSKLHYQLEHGFEFGPACRLIQSLDQNSAGEVTVVFPGLLILLEEVGGRIIVKIPGGVRSTNNELPTDLSELCDQFIALVKAEAGSVPVDEILV